ncbi:MAG TPA: class I SAM-dependent methyltransferase [Candidatus Woesearchaeota archaeon]|nr:class I SAM-dependent methyltransferase [Candidatus Woesearchaeota archaeon]
MSHYYSKKQESLLELKKITVVLRGKTLEFYTGSGVFSKKKIDDGSYILIQNAIIKKGWSALDLGCGYGPVGIAIAKSEGAKVTLSDVNERAVNLTERNIQLNKVDAEVRSSDVFGQIPETFDTILLNPPQTAGKKLCFRMIEESKDHLKKNGLLQLVARPRKGGKTLAEKMKEVFGNVQVISKGAGFSVYASKKK